MNYHIFYQHSYLSFQCESSYLDLLFKSSAMPLHHDYYETCLFQILLVCIYKGDNSIEFEERTTNMKPEAAPYQIVNSDINDKSN